MFAAALSGMSALGADASVQLITLDPGHFHASLIQKFMYPQVSPVVHVYSPVSGPDLDEHLKRVAAFNSRAENPTRWDEKAYIGTDFLDRMCQEKAGNVVVIAGNNLRKTEYIERSVASGFHVLADKPMAITPDGFDRLLRAFDVAKKNHVLLYDIMTERFEITSILQRELARVPDVFGTLEKGTPDSPAAVMVSVHNVCKQVSGKPVLRPPWFFDPAQQGEAIPDVGTHLVDLVQWECFPGQVLDWRKDVNVISARKWPTVLTQEQFKQVSGLDDYPQFLKPFVGDDNKFNLRENGEVTWKLKGVCAKVTALWNFESPGGQFGSKDTHYSMLRGTRATLSIRQGPEENYSPALYVEKAAGVDARAFEPALQTAVSNIAKTWPGIEVKKLADKWQIVIPAKYSVGHEAHFTQVAETFLRYLKDNTMPEWERAAMLAKYRTTIDAIKLQK